MRRLVAFIGEGFSADPFQFQPAEKPAYHLSLHF